MKDSDTTAVMVPDGWYMDAAGQLVRKIPTEPPTTVREIENHWDKQDGEPPRHTEMMQRGPIQPLTLDVYRAINLVQADLVKIGLGKDQKNKFDNYMYRGIDGLYNALGPLLAKHGLCVLPRVLSRESTERKSDKGKALFYVVVDVEFDFVAASDGSKHTVRMFGEAMDRGDKATNKAITAAYKYAAFQAFAIPTEGTPDADEESHEVAPTKAEAKKSRKRARDAAEPKAKAKPKSESKTPANQTESGSTVQIGVGPPGPSETAAAREEDIWINYGKDQVLQFDGRGTWEQLMESEYEPAHKAAVKMVIVAAERDNVQSVELFEKLRDAAGSAVAFKAFGEVSIFALASVFDELDCPLL